MMAIYKARSQGRFVDPSRVVLGGPDGRQPTYLWADVVEHFRRADVRHRAGIERRVGRAREAAASRGAMERVGVSVPESGMAWLRAEAGRRGTSVPDVVRGLLADAFGSDG